MKMNPKIARQISLFIFQSSKMSLITNYRLSRNNNGSKIKAPITNQVMI